MRILLAWNSLFFGAMPVQSCHQLLSLKPIEMVVPLGEAQFWNGVFWTEQRGGSQPWPGDPPLLSLIELASSRRSRNSETAKTASEQIAETGACWEQEAQV